MSEFVKSSKCRDGYCIEVGAGFRKSTRSWTRECVEVGRPGGVPVLIRDSKADPSTAPVLSVSPQAWTAFLGTV